MCLAHVGGGWGATIRRSSRAELFKNKVRINVVLAQLTRFVSMVVAFQ